MSAAPGHHDDDARRQVEGKVARLQAARASHVGVWRHLAHVGVLGWVFILPVIGGVVIGRWLSRWLETSLPTLVGILAGVLAGGVGVWLQLRRSLDDDEAGGIG